MGRIERVSVTKPNDPLAGNATRLFRQAGFQNASVKVERVYRLETNGTVTFQGFLRLLCDESAGEKLQVEDNHFRPGTTKANVVEIAYRPSVIDPETETGLGYARQLGIPIEWIRTSCRYIVEGVPDSQIHEVVNARLFNSVVQVVVGSEDYTTSLKPLGKPEPMGYIDMSGLNKNELIRLNATKQWHAPMFVLSGLQRFQTERIRPWTDAEVELVVQSLSDHCYHTTWKGLGLLDALKQATYNINHPLMRPPFIDNAGGIEFYDGQVIIVKFESHNHPSAIATKGGIETKHGGCLRDIIFHGKGGYPIGCATLIGTMDPGLREKDVPSGALHPRRIVNEAIEGTEVYCNPMGVPMMYADYAQNPGYTKCWALGGAIGIIPLMYDQKEEPQEDDYLILIGGETGRDGVHGATASSAQLTAEMVIKEAATVQIGHPITERNFCTVMPILRDEGLIVSCNDLGAGGLSCVIGESCKNCGANICLTNLPLKDSSLASWEKLLSESQERGLLIVRPEHLKRTIEICSQYNVKTFVLGQCRNDGRLVVTDNDVTAVDIDLGMVWHGFKPPKLSTQKPQTTLKVLKPESHIWNTGTHLLRNIVTDYAICSKESAIVRYDSTVQGNTVVGPLVNGVPTDAFICAPIRGKHYGVVSSTAFVPRWSVADPVGSVGCLMALAISRTIATGVAPNEIALCGNYYTPTRTPEQRWILRQMVAKRAAPLSEMFGTPYVSGKDSSSGTYIDKEGKCIDVPATLVPSTLARMPDVRQRIPKLFSKPTDNIYLLRPKTAINFGGSVIADYLEPRIDNVGYKLPWPKQPKDIANLWSIYHEHCSAFSSAAAIGPGGAFLQIFHSCLGSGLGADILISENNPFWNLFGEAPASFVISAPKQTMQQLKSDVGRQFDLVLLGEVSAKGGIEIRSNSTMPFTWFSKNEWQGLVEHWKTTFEEATR